MPQSQQIIDLALPPTRSLGGEGVDAGIHTDIADEELRTLDEMSHLILAPLAEATLRICHRDLRALASLIT
jgi:hypothetical protein